jgi:2,4-dienoyl-CoA reductase-like NADH-dependent reductase (Old Yellow Enzyme family)
MPGSDGAEIHGAHAHEIAQFLSPLYNHRKDSYGGDLAGKSRFALETVRLIEQTAGDDFPVIFRSGAEEYMPGGRGLDESLQLAWMLMDAGADSLPVSVGTPDSE